MDAAREARAQRNRDLSYFKGELKYVEGLFVDSEEDLVKKGYLDPERNMSMFGVARRLVESENEDDMRKLGRFLRSVYDYQGDKHFEIGRGAQQNTHRERRERIAQTFDELPEYLKRQFSKSSDIMNVLYRGGDMVAGKPKFTSAGPDGKVNASFSMDKSWAEFFGKSSTARPRPPGTTGSYVFSKKDVAGHGSIIDLYAVGDFRRRLATYTDRMLKIANIEAETDRSKDKKVKFLAALDGELNDAGGDYYGASAQDEYLITDVRWNKPKD